MGDTRYRVRRRKDARDADVPKGFKPSTHTSREAADRKARTWKDFDAWGEVRAITSGSNPSYDERNAGNRQLISMKLPHETLDDMDSMQEERGEIGRTELVVQLVAEEKKRRRK